MEERLAQRPSSCIKIVLFGPESTGKTTLASQLAEHYNTPWVKEYMREYLQEKWDEERNICQPEDLLPIAEGQMKRENELAAIAGDLLICDTDLLELKVYAEAYYNGYCPQLLLKPALNHHYDLYFLTYIDVKWTPDDLRDKPDDRIGMFERFKAALEQNNKPFVVLKGNEEERFKTAVSIIDKQLNNKKVKLSEKDTAQINKKGISVQEVEDQVEIFKRGNIKVDISEAATAGKGIFAFSDKEKEEFIKLYDSKKKELDVIKFVPASGAATRMFKALHNFVDEFDPGKEGLRSYLDRKENENLQRFFEKIDDLPFYSLAIDYARKNNENFDKLSHDERHLVIVKNILFEEGLDLGNYPKGLVPFHKYRSGLRTAFEEHLIEAADFIAVDGVANVHFTISEDHQDRFKKEFENIKERAEEKTGVKFKVSFSFQDPKTDTIAVDDNNEPFRTTEGELFFRPGGHGALIENLNNQKADLAFLKNIDNVVTEENIAEVVHYKKMLGGKLLKLQEKCFEILEKLDSGNISEDEIKEISEFLQNELFRSLEAKFDGLSSEEKIKYLKDKINRPLRVGGMVKNEGEPGGGPFLVRDENGEISLQIIEGAQIDQDNPEQVKTAREATHFNPVDLVCGLKNYKGESFDLNDYVDPKTSFIADKTKDGKPLKALERPGLWNGAMAKWNTVFVEVPVSTFNPVKSVADLLKESHQVRK
ncbi:DUF4301 family protein [Salegentibacter sp. F188]|uniref:DUF4301 family protein n=1 Tax=Autumnicola patrickiae TaxID=3075591 RepID=A0ABU3E1T4_9FLAO|nr:DUF4301 family protein [Salegentibacter sp. F188]MDT0689928.1 DUF4301 family protein [Salegentibacter sp. F188]